MSVRPSRILRVVTRLNVGGPARQVIYLTKALDSRGFSSVLAWGSAAPEEGELPPPADAPNVRIGSLRRDLHPLGDARALLMLRRLMRERRPHVVHTHMAKAGTLGRLAARQSEVPATVHTFHGHVLEGYFSRPFTRVVLEVERRLAQRTDALLAVSAAVRDELLDLGIGTPERWHVVPVGLELGSLLRAEVRGADARRALNLPLTGPVIGVVGRLVPIKDHNTFVDAAAHVMRARPEATFVVAGDGEARAAVERRARGILGDRCRFLGWVSDLPTLYAALDVVVLTSRNEGTPVALVEAGAACKPVVATRVGGVPDVVRDGETGLLAPPGDAAALAAHVSALLEVPDRGRAMGERGRVWVRDRFSAERLADDLASLYRALLARKGLRPPDAGPPDETVR